MSEELEILDKLIYNLSVMDYSLAIITAILIILLIIGKILDKVDFIMYKVFPIGFIIFGLCILVSL